MAGQALDSNLNTRTLPLKLTSGNLMTEHYMANPAICLPGLRLACNNGLKRSDLLAEMELPESVEKGLLAGQLSQKLQASDYLTTAQQLQFSINLQKHFDDPAIGLSIGNSSNFGDLGILGLTMLSAPNLRQAIQVGALYAHIGGTLSHIQCKEQGSKLSIQVTPPALEPQLHRYLVEEQFAAFVCYVKEILHHRPDCDRIFEHIAFSYPEPIYSDRYRHFFRCPVSFNQARNECWVDAQLLSVTTAYANAHSFESCSRLCQNALDTLRQKDAIILQLKSWLTSLPREFPKLEDAAAQTGTNSRALRRKLEELGTSFTRLIAETKVEQAKTFLEKMDLSVQDISELLGYSEVTNFRRAFKSWTGVSPKHYRQNAQTKLTANAPP